MEALSAWLPVLELVILNCGLSYSQALVLRAGVFSLATAPLACLGAYTAAVLQKTYGCPPALAVLAAAAVGIAGAGLLSIPLSRLRGVFQAIATLAFGQIVVSLTLYAEPVTGGAMGLNGIPKFATLPVLLAFILALMYVVWAVGRGGLGRAFDAMRQDELVSASFGIPVARYHALVFMLSGAVAGLTGSLIAFHNYSLEPQEFGFGMLVAALSFVIIGGRAGVAGPLVGATLMTLLPEVFRVFAEYRMLASGILLVVVIAVLPHGVADSLRATLQRRSVGRLAPAPAT